MSRDMKKSMEETTTMVRQRFKYTSKAISTKKGTRKKLHQYRKSDVVPVD